MPPRATLEDSLADAINNVELIEAAKKYKFRRNNEKEASPQEIQSAMDRFDNL
jgi:hypothetical protein